jgi:hypothetical protein
MFTRDLVTNVLVGLPDRAEVLEQAWSDSFDKTCRHQLESNECPVDLKDGFLKLWPQEKWPALILNGTIVETGGRAVASNLDLHCKSGDAKATCGLVDVTDILAYQPFDLTARRHQCQRSVSHSWPFSAHYNRRGRTSTERR